MTRVYTLDTKKAIGNNDLIPGTCHLNNKSLLCIVLCGATHYFISIQCMECLWLKADPLCLSMVVTTAVDDIVETKWTCENCLLLVNGRAFHIDLICLLLKKVEVVLGMDWLSTNLVFIGYEKNNNNYSNWWSYSEICDDYSFGRYDSYGKLFIQEIKVFSIDSHMGIKWRI